MPTNLVKTPADEATWNRAKRLVHEQYDLSEDSDRFYALTTAIYQKMQGVAKARSRDPMAELCKQMVTTVKKCGTTRRGWAMKCVERAMKDHFGKCTCPGPDCPIHHVTKALLVVQD